MAIISISVGSKIGHKVAALKGKDPAKDLKQQLADTRSLLQQLSEQHEDYLEKYNAEHKKLLNQQHALERQIKSQLAKLKSSDGNLNTSK